MFSNKKGRAANPRGTAKLGQVIEEVHHPADVRQRGGKRLAHQGAIEGRPRLGC